MHDNPADAQQSLQGLFNIAVTPFEVDGNINYDALSANIERVIDLGYDGVLVGGQYGEFASMTPDERAELFRRAMDFVGDRVPVLLGAPSSNPRVVAELSELAGNLGGIPMITAPYVSEVTDGHIIEYFKDIAAVSRTGVVIYNMPEIGLTISPELLEQLADIPNIIGVKQGDLTPSVIDRIAGRLLDKIRVLCASDLHFMGPLMRGFHGISSTNSSAFPEVILETFRSLQAGDANRAKDLHAKWYPIRELIREFGQPQTTKAVMTLRGWFGGSVRTPLRDLTPKQFLRLRETLAQIASDSDIGIGRLAA
jgi:4-hydroxy-tetrahydrodipicolinate synthase